MKFTRVIAAAALFVLLLPAVPASAATRMVNIPGNYFSPPTIRVHIGDTVRWFNDTSNNHTVTSNSDSDESFNSSTNCPGSIIFGNDCIKRGGSYSHTFDARGTFTYHCKIHGSNVSFPNCGMCGRVVVVAKSSPTITPTSPGPTPTGTPTTMSPSPSPSGSPTTPGISPDSSPKAAGPDDGSNNTPTIALAALGVVLLAGSGFLVYRTMIRR